MQEVTQEPRQDKRIAERMDKFKEYLASEISARKNTRPHKIMMSITDHAALMRLYKCAGKGWAYLEGLIVSGDKEIVQSVQYFMKILEITDPESLKAWGARVERLADILVRRQKNGRDGITDDEFSLMKKFRDIEEDDKPTRLLLLTSMSLFAVNCGEEFTPKSMMAEYLEIMNPHKVIGLYKMLFQTITAYRRRDRKPARQNLEAPVQTPETPIQEEGHEAAVNEVLDLLNSQESGMLLDQFAKAENTLRQLAAKEIAIPEELSSLSLCVKIFMRTMRNVFGISPVFKTGEILEMSLDQAQRYIYSGSDFADDEDTKKVEVIAPGWKRGEDIFSLPRIIEHR